MIIKRKLTCLITSFQLKASIKTQPPISMSTKPTALRTDTKKLQFKYVTHTKCLKQVLFINQFLFDNNILNRKQFGLGTVIRPIMLFYAQQKKSDSILINIM